MLVCSPAVTRHALPIALTPRRSPSSQHQGQYTLPMDADDDLRRETSDPGQQQDAAPASRAAAPSPAEEAPSSAVEILPTAESREFTDEMSSAAESPVAQPTADPYTCMIPVPGNKYGKQIYPLAPVQSSTWTEKDYDKRFRFVKTELRSTVNQDPKLRDLAPHICYELRMVGVNPELAVPSIVITCNCQARDMRSLQSLFARAEDKLYLREGSLKDCLFKARPRTIPRLPLVYYLSKRGPLIRMASDESITAYFGNDWTYCGGLIKYQGASATLGLSLRIDDINAHLTVDHLFSRPSLEPDSIPALEDPPSDAPDNSSLSDDEYDFEDIAEGDTEGKTPDSTSPEADMTTKHSEQWELITVTPDPSSPYLDWLLARPQLQIESPYLSVGYINAFFLDGPGGRAVSINRIRDEPRVHLAPVYMISGVRGVLRGRILASSTFLGSPHGQDDCEVWTVVMDSPQGIVFDGTA